MMYSFESSLGEKIRILKITEEGCADHSIEILDIINIIPFIHWNVEDLLSHKEDYYHNKWNYSYYAINDEDEIVGVLIAYFRLADGKHIFDSLYLHRLAVRPDYQNRGIGTEMLSYFVNAAFHEIPWLLNITAQTNQNDRNEYVIQFYHKFGFRDMYQVDYPEKTDILMMLERHRYNINLKYHFLRKSDFLAHPRFPGCFEVPLIFFASTNPKKKEIVQFIFHNYNIEVKFVKSPIELTEPQIEAPDLEEERKLVSYPLKLVSRFVNDNYPYTIEDTMLFVEYFNNGDKWELPGFDTKRWLRQMGLDGFLKIMGNTNSRKAKFVSQVGAYVKSHTYYYGRGEINGRIALAKSIVSKPLYGTYPYFFHLIFIPDGENKTLAEMNMFEYAKYDYMRKAIKELIEQIAHDDSFIRNRQYTIFDYYSEETSYEKSSIN